VFISIAAMVAASVNGYVVNISSTYRSIRIPSPRFFQVVCFIETVICFLESGDDCWCVGSLPGGPAFRKGPVHVVINFGMLYGTYIQMIPPK
jgi:hypothetical protein